MRQTIIQILSIAILVMAIPFQSSGSEKEIDFNFPQDVSKDALADLDQALKSGDGELVVDALVRYSIAQSGISQDNMGDIISRLETVLGNEQRPHIRALLLHLEALIYQGYNDRYARWSDRRNPVEELPVDVSEWDRLQFDNQVATLLEQSLADAESLRRVSVTSMPKVIKCNELGSTYVPTLLEFLSMKGLELLSRQEQSVDQVGVSLDERIKNGWMNATEGNIPAHIFALVQTHPAASVETYHQYLDNEHCALLLDHMSWENDKERYKTLQDYVARYPSSIHTAHVKNAIIGMEAQSVNAAAAAVSSSRDSITVRSSVKNVNSFWLNVYRVPEQELQSSRSGRINPMKLELLSQTPVSVQGTVPFQVNDILTVLPPLPHGAYYICPSIGHNDRVTTDIYQSRLTRVTDIATFSVSKDAADGIIAAVDLTTGKPMSGVTILSDKGATVGVTGSDGLLRLQTPQKYLQYRAIRGQDHYGPVSSYYPGGKQEYQSYHVNIYTDLGVYRPGETIQWSALISHSDQDSRVPVAGKQVVVKFQDANYEEIEQLKAVTDEFGRLEGAFTVPRDRMNGNFVITIESRFDKDETTIGSHQVAISEYKIPTFEVAFPEARNNYVAGQPVQVTGQVMTYSGLPVQNTEVRLSLIQNEWSWRWRYSNRTGEHLSDTTVMTDGQGRFTIEFSPALFRENEGYQPGKRHYCSRYHYEVAAVVTTDAGETQEASTSFVVGTRRGIALGEENEGCYLNDKPIKLPLQYNTTDEEHPTTYCTWEVTPVDGQAPVLTGNLNTADPTIDLTTLPSGQYKLKVHILDAEEGEQDVDVERVITLTRHGDKQSPVKDCPLWISPLRQTVDQHHVGHLTIGVSTSEAHIYYIATTHDGVIADGWLHYGPGMHDFTVTLPREAGCDVRVMFYTVHAGKEWENAVTLHNPYKAEALKITATSFRNKLVPGETEHWTFTLTDQNGKPRPGALLLDMYDKAIASIADNDWYYDNFSRRWAFINFNAMPLDNQCYSNCYHTQRELKDNVDIQLPQLNTYGQTFFGYGMGRRMMRMAKNDLYSTAMVEEAAMMAEGAIDSENATADGIMASAKAANGYAEADMGETVQVNEKDLDKIPLRENDIKTALWKPMLTSDNQGNVSVEFEAPNFNTTWIVQAVAVDKQTLGSTWMAEVLTQKPLMVRATLPRFLRQGDKAQLAATVQNATDKAATCDAVIELFDPRSGAIYASRAFNLSLAPSGSQAVAIDWQVPDTIAMLGFRIKAAGNQFGDGEQVMVPVLTTISPVIETEPFYIEASQGHHEVTLPHFPADARVTLEYCDNPAWYCVLALPTIFSDEYHVATQAAHSLFALQVAQGVAKSQPQIQEAVNYWKEHAEDSTLVSMLQKNQDLKIGTLLASPWMRDADRQTLRMSKLHELFDKDIMKQEYEIIITALQSLQMDDGGFTWFRHPGCKSNVWTTGEVLQLIGEIKHLGFLPDDERLTQMTRRALSYYDSENVRLLNEYKKYSKEPYGQFTDYAYTRSLYAEAQHSTASADLLKKTLKHMDKTWKDGITLKEKGYYAMTLHRNGYHKTAANIIESIRQFAIRKPSLGMYWDNLQTSYGWWEYDKIAYTSTILQAMSEVDPHQDEIDQVRKWMLLMKQSNDWGTNSLAADAVYSILSTGSQWIDRSEQPVITVAGQPVELDKMAQWLGYVRCSLPATTAGNVVIERSGKGPAWGAIYSQFKAQMTDVKEKSIEEVSISKEYYAYSKDGSLRQVNNFQVGDKVKVRLVIKVNKDMDFVTISDERASCFEPVDQLSGYRSEDNTWFYQETKDTQTNVFVGSLDKGTHIIGYDVWVTNPGQFTSGIATIQCQYAPQLSAHSSRKRITVFEK